jgi:hypothetical protein
MASKEVVDAVNARLASWTTLPFVGPNLEGDTPADASQYVLVDYPVANAMQMSVGAPGYNVWREEGVFRLIIHAGRGKGVDDALIYAGQLAALFRGKSFDGVNTDAPSPPITDDRSENGNYFLIAIAIPYEFDLIG